MKNQSNLTPTKWWNKQSKNRKHLLYQTYRFAKGLQMSSIHHVKKHEIETMYNEEKLKNKLPKVGGIELRCPKSHVFYNLKY